MKKIIMIWGIITAASFACAVLAGNQRTIELFNVSDGVAEGNEVFLIDSLEEDYRIIHTKRSGGMAGEIRIPKLDGSIWNAYRFLTLDGGGSTKDTSEITAYVYRYGTSMESNEEQSEVYRCNFKTGKLEPMWQLPGVRLHGIRVENGILYYAVPKDETDVDSFITYYSMNQNGERTLLGIYEFPYSSTVSTYYSTTYKTAMWSDYNGRIYYYGAIKHVDGDGQNEYVHLLLGDKGTYRTNLAGNRTELVPARGRKEIPLFSLDQIKLDDLGLDYSDVIPFYYDSDGVWTAGVNTEGSHRVLGIFDRSGRRLQIISRIEKAPGFLDKKTWQTGAFVFLLMSLAAGGILAYLRRTGGTVPILAGLLTILIPAIGICSYQLSERIYESFRNRVIRMEENLLYEIADQMLSRFRPSDMVSIDVKKIPEDPYYQKMFGYEDHFRSDKVMYHSDGTKMPVTVRTYRWLYLLQDGALRYAFVEDNYYGGKVSYYRDQEQMDRMQTAINKKQVIASEYTDQEGSWVVLYVPVFGEGKTVLGIMESGMNRGVVQYEIGQEIQTLYQQVALVMGILCGILILVLGTTLYPLRRLKRAVNAMAAGELGATVKVSGHTEVADITEAFNHMSLRIQEQMEFIRKCLSGYEKFVPEKVFEILKRRDITEVELGDQKEITAAVLASGAADFTSYERTLSGEDLYAMINLMMCTMIPAVGARQGVVDRMTDTGITAFYPTPAGCRSALMSAVSICENRKVRRSKGEEIPRLLTAIAYGPIRVGIVGEGSRAAAATIAEIIPFVEFLKNIAGKYGASILISHTAASEIWDFQASYHSRMIGYIYLTRADRYEPVYEVFDGDEAGEKRRKEETRELFDAALKDYYDQRYYEARQKFAKILKENRDDRVSREYVFRCDQYYRMKDAANTLRYLEKY